MALRKTDEEKLVKSLRELNTRVSELVDRIGLDDQRETYQHEIDALKREISALKIDRDREQERWNRERREVEHHVGLHKKQMESEAKLNAQEREAKLRAATKDAELKVREEHINAKEDMFEERMRAVTDQLKDQVEYLRTDIVGQLMTRLPIFNVDTAIQPHGPRVIEAK